MDKAIFDEMIATRRHLHTIPEEGWTNSKPPISLLNV